MTFNRVHHFCSQTVSISVSSNSDDRVVYFAVYFLIIFWTFCISVVDLICNTFGVIYRLHILLGMFSNFDENTMRQFFFTCRTIRLGRFIEYLCRLYLKWNSGAF